VFIYSYLLVLHTWSEDCFCDPLPFGLRLLWP